MVLIKKRACQNANTILIILRFETIHKKRPFLYSILSKEMVFFFKYTYSLKLVKLLICILTHPLFLFSKTYSAHKNSQQFSSKQSTIFQKQSTVFSKKVDCFFKKGWRFFQKGLTVFSKRVDGFFKKGWRFSQKGLTVFTK